MNHEDSLSKLFRDASDRIDEKPSANLWDRLEVRLDEQMPVSKDTSQHHTGGSTRVVSMSRRWMAAASIIAVVFVSIGVIRMLRTNENTASSLAENAYERNVPLEDLPTLDNSLPIAALTEREEAQLQAKADKIQAEEMLQRAKVTPTTATTAKIDQISTVEANVALADNRANEVEDFITIEMENNSAADISKGSSSATSTNKFSASPELIREAGNVVETNNSLRYYSDVVPSVSNSATVYEQFKASEEWDDYKNNVQQSNAYIAAKDVAGDGNLKKTVLSSKTKARGKELAKPNAPELHSSLQIFDWLIGTWKDTKQYAGNSYEEWAVKDAYTLSGRGYVINESKNSKLFQEQIRIVFNTDLRQVFLIAALDDSGTEISYMLSGYDLSSGEYIFKQNEYTQYPGQVILQKDLVNDGFTTIIVDKNNKKNSLNADQQRYLDNRNHVSGARAIRNMSRVRAY